MHSGGRLCHTNQKQMQIPRLGLALLSLARDDLCNLAAEVEGGGEVAAGDRLRLLLPEDFIDFQAFDTDLARCFAHPNHASVGAVDASLQHDHVAEAEVVTSGMDAGTGG